MHRFRTAAIFVALVSLAILGCSTGSLNPMNAPGIRPSSPCVNPLCDCACHPGGSGICKCAAGTCDCECPHIKCDGNTCEIIYGDGESTPIPPAPPANHSGGWGQSSPGEVVECPDPRLAGDVPKECREWYHNLSNPGSCVQCSIGMCGVDQGVSEASTLLWDTRFGEAEHHGSWPSRVADYARARGMRIYNVTGRYTYEWMQWACRNGRPVAIGCSTAHFQTLMGYDASSKSWYVCNNNSPQKIDVYSDAQFRRLHEASGQWCVILDYPPSPARSNYSAWWGLN